MDAVKLRKGRTLGRDEKVDAGLARLALELLGDAAHLAHGPVALADVSS